MRLDRVDGVFFSFCLCSSLAFLIASRTAIDDPALVILTAVGVVLGLAVTEPDEVCMERLGDLGVEGEDGRKEAIGVTGLDLDGLNAELTCVRGLETEDEDGAVFRGTCDIALFAGFVDLVVRAGFRRDSSCLSLAKRRLSFVLADNVKDGVCGGMALAEGGVVMLLNS
jgi:hypothetical protein